MITEIKAQIMNTIGKVIFNFNIIEKKIDSIITHYFHIEEEKQEFFKTHLLNTSIISFASKVKLLKQIFEHIEIEDIKSTIKLLEELNKYRNIFAHCSIEFEQVKLDIENLKNLDVNVNEETTFLEAKLKHTMNAQGKISDKKFFELYEEFKQKTIEVEKILNDINQGITLI